MINQKICYLTGDKTYGKTSYCWRRWQNTVLKQSYKVESYYNSRKKIWKITKKVFLQVHTYSRWKDKQNCSTLLHFLRRKKHLQVTGPRTQVSKLQSTGQFRPGNIISLDATTIQGRISFICKPTAICSSSFQPLGI